MALLLKIIVPSQDKEVVFIFYSFFLLASYRKKIKTSRGSSVAGLKSVAF